MALCKVLANTFSSLATSGTLRPSAQAIAAFESKCKRAGIAPPECYPPGASGDSITTNELSYPRRTCAAGMREGHGWVSVDTRNDLLPR